MDWVRRSFIRPVAAALLCGGAALALAAKHPPAPERLRVVRAVHSYGWLPQGPDTMVLWLGVEEPYLVRLAPGCPDLTRNTPTGLTRHGRRIVVGTDSVLFGRTACPLRAIEPVDGAKLAGQPSRRRPFPLVALPATKDRARR